MNMNNDGVVVNESESNETTNDSRNDGLHYENKMLVMQWIAMTVSEADQMENSMDSLDGVQYTH